MRVIFDANIWVSFSLGKKLPGLKEILIDGFIKVFSSEELLHEIRSACRKPQVRKYLPVQRYRQLMEMHQHFTTPSHFSRRLKLSRDPKDDYLLDMSEQEEIDFLATGDKDLLALGSHKRMKIVRYVEFLRIIEEHQFLFFKQYLEILPSGINIVNTRVDHAQQLEALQKKVFPSLAEDELLHANQYKKHVEIFPDGQFVALDGEKVVGATTSMRYHYDFDQPEHHTFKEVMGGGWLTTHEPDGEWLYGIDVSVDTEYRKMGIAKALYRARQHTCRQLGLKGQITVGMLNGFETVSDKMSVREYYEKVRNNELFDRTVSVQQKIGFEIVGFMKDYLHDPTCGNSGAMLVLDSKKEL